MSSDRPTDPAPPPTSESQQMRALKPLEFVIRDMSERTLAISERLGELAGLVTGLAMTVGELRTELAKHHERFAALERRLVALESNGAEAP